MEVSDLVRSLLKRRGIEADEQIEAFLHPDYEAHTHDPMLLHHMDLALERLFAALEKQERIAIYADYDCDGISGAVVLSDFLRKIGYENFEVYLPHRDREGYGFHARAVETLAAGAVRVIITADVGTLAYDGISRAKELGVDVIVTDHHEAPQQLPEATAVVNPMLGEYPFAHICGAAVAYKLVQAALREGRRRGMPQFLSIPDGWEKWLLDVVAFATISDMMPLLDENRALVHWGLAVARKSSRVGVDALCDLARIKKNTLTEDDVGFTIAPRINAASRMDEPRLAFALLTTTDRMHAALLARKLEELNAKRKGAVAAITKEARKRMHARCGDEQRVVALGDTAWKPSLVGLAANTLMQERGGVVCLWGQDASGNLKGSCRSDGSVSLIDLFAQAGDVLQEAGGHACSGGFTLVRERAHELPERLEKAALGASQEMGRAACVEHDAELPLSAISMKLLHELSRLSPFGVGNPKPVFRLQDASVSRVRRFGKEQNHVEAMLADVSSGASVRAFQFFKGPNDFSVPLNEGMEAQVLATVERDSFRGGATLRLVDILSR